MIKKIILSAALLLVGCNNTDVEAKAPPKQGTISFIFDDGDASIMKNAYPVFRKEKVPASVAIFTNGLNGSGRMTSNDLKTLKRSKWEVLSHGVTHTTLKGMIENKLNTELTTSKEKLSATGFVSPFSFFPEQHTKHLKNSYRYAFNGYVDSRKQPIEEMTANTRTPYNLKRANMQFKSLEELKAYVDYAYEKRVWIVLYEHKINVKGHTSKRTLEALVKYAKEKNVNIKTPNKVIR